MKRTITKALGILLAVVMMLGMMPSLGQVAYAAGEQVTTQPVGGTTGIFETYNINYATNFEYVKARLYEGSPEASHTFRKMLSTSGSDTVPAESSKKTITFYIEFELSNDGLTRYIYSNQFDVSWDSYIIHHDAYGGFGSMEDVYKSTTSIETYVLPTCGFTPPSDLYEFDYWVVVDRDANTKLYDNKAAGDSISVDRNLIIQARWKKISHTVTFDANGHGTAPAAQTVTHGESATRPTDPTASGWSFNGWYTDSEGTTAYEFYQSVTSDITLFAKWTKVVGEITDLSATVTLPEAGAHPVFTGTPGDSSTYYVNDVIFEDENNDVITASDTFEEGKQYYVFVHFKPTAGNTFANPLSSVTINGINATRQLIYGDNSVLYVIEYTVPTEVTDYTVTITSDGNGSASASPTKGVTGTEVTLTATPNSGYKFKEWQIVSGGVTVTDNKFTIGTANVEIKAIFEVIPVTTYTVTFDANGHGTAPAAQTVNSGEKATEPTAPTETGWTFGGWYQDATCSVAFDFSTAITADITLYAKWTEESTTPVTYTVTFDANGHGTAPVAQTVNSGEKATEPTAPTETGWTFGGWYQDATCSVAFDFSTAITADTTIYAKWKANTSDDKTKYTITYNLNGGTMDGKTGTVTADYEDGTTITLPTPTRDGYTFDYWEGSRYEVGASYKVTENHTFTAQWKKNSSFDNNNSNNNSNTSTSDTTKKHNVVNTGVKAPATGDNSNIALWGVVLAASLLGFIFTMIKRRKYSH